MLFSILVPCTTVNCLFLGYVSRRILSEINRLCNGLTCSCLNVSLVLRSSELYERPLICPFLLTDNLLSFIVGELKSLISSFRIYDSYASCFGVSVPFFWWLPHDSTMCSVSFRSNKWVLFLDFFHVSLSSPLFLWVSKLYGSLYSPSLL